MKYNVYMQYTVNTALTKKRNRLTGHVASTEVKRSVSISYIQEVTELLQGVYRKWRVALHFKSQNTIRRLLIASNDKLEKDEKCGSSTTLDNKTVHKHM